MELFLTPILWWVGIVIFMIVLYYVCDYYWGQYKRVEARELNPKYMKKWPAVLVITMVVMLLLMPVKFSDKRTNSVIINSFDTEVGEYEIKKIKQRDKYGAPDNAKEINEITGGE